MPKELAHGALHLRHAGRAAHQHYALDLLNGQAGIAQGCAYSRQGARCQGLRGGFKISPMNLKHQLRLAQVGLKHANL